MLTRILLALALSIGTTLGAAPSAQADSMARDLGRDFRKAWQTTRGKGVTIAVLSTGVDTKVDTLRGAVTTGPDFVKIGRNSRPIAGTLLSSFIAGSGPSLDSPLGVRGLAPATRILSVRVAPDPGEARIQRFNQRSQAWEKAMSKGIRYAADKGAKVIVTHTYAEGGSAGLREAVNYALAKNAVVVSGAYPADEAGEYIGILTEPASLSGVIGVGTVGANGKRIKKYSSENASVLVSGPGIRVPATGPGNRPYVFWGSQVAAGTVAAAAGLIKAEFPDLQPSAVAQAMAKSARRSPKGGYDMKTGYGIINPAGALKEARRLGNPAEVAKSGPVADKSHFAGRPEPVAAVQHSTAELGAYAGLLALGLVLCGAAFAMFRRGRPRPATMPLAPGAPMAPGTAVPRAFGADVPMTREADADPG